MGKCKAIIIILMLAVTCVAAAQSEVNTGKILSGDSLRVERNIQDIDSIFTEQDSSILFKPVMPTSITKAATKLDYDPRLLDYRRGSWEVNSIQGGKLLLPWRGAAVIVSGGANSMPGLLDRESGALTFYQNIGRWSFSGDSLIS